jgi:hypothetical protein
MTLGNATCMCFLSATSGRAQQRRSSRRGQEGIAVAIAGLTGNGKQLQRQPPDIHSLGKFPISRKAGLGSYAITSVLRCGNLCAGVCLIMQVSTLTFRISWWRGCTWRYKRLVHCCPRNSCAVDRIPGLEFLLSGSKIARGARTANRANSQSAHRISI